MRTQATIYAYPDSDYEIPACSPNRPATFFASSHGGGQAPVSGAPFITDDARFDNKRFGAREWLYFPVPFSQALLAVGVHNIVHCHSGRTVVDGAYVSEVAA